MLRHLAAIGLTGFVCWSGSCAAQTADQGAVRVGDRWAYAVRDSATGDMRNMHTVDVVDVNDKQIATRVSFRGKDRPETVVFDPNWGMIEDGSWKFRPSEIGIKTPLRVGKEWRSDYNGLNAQTGVAIRFSSVAKVVAQERTTTPAGTFDTYRVETKILQIHSGDQTKASRLTYVRWYAPSINRWVKGTIELHRDGRVRDSTTEELITYSRKP